MDTNSLRWFQQVADGTTVTAVSDLETVTQSGVSRALARLEAEVGTPLLRRSGRILRMTRAGAAFKRHVDALLHHLDDGLAAVDQLIDPETGNVAIAFQLSLGTWLVPDLLSSFRAVHPNIRFLLRQVRDELVTPALDGGLVDLEIGTRRPHDPSVQWRRLALEPLRLAMPRHHPHAKRTQLHLTDVSGEPFVSLRTTSALRTQCDQLCARAGFSPTIAFEGEDLPTVRGLVAAGLGVAIVPALREGSSETGSGPLRYAEILDHGASREIGLTWSLERPLLPATELFRLHAIERSRAGLLPAVAPNG